MVVKSPLEICKDLIFANTNRYKWNDHVEYGGGAT